MVGWRLEGGEKNGDWKGRKMLFQYKNDFWCTDSSLTHILFPQPGYLKGRKKIKYILKNI